MLRRSRISVRPNVRPAGRGPAAPASSQDTPPSTQASEAPSQAGGQEVDTATTAVLETSTESTTPRENEKDPSGEASSGTPSASIQRRKRFSVMPNLATPRAAGNLSLTRSSPRTSKSPVRAGTETPAPEAPKAPSQTDAGPSQGMRSPRRRPSGGSRQAKVQPKPSPLSPSSPAPETTTPSLGKQAVEDSSLSQQTLQAADKEETSSQVTKQDKGSIQSDLSKKTPATKALSNPSENFPSSSLPRKEGISVSERAKTLAARSMSVWLTGLAPGKSRLSRFLNDPTDLQRLAKARKLRELLRQEMNKEKKLRKAKVCWSEYTLDPSKMTMRDLLYYLPDTNPMTSYLEEEPREKEIVLPLTPPREESPERPPTPEAPAETASQRDEEDDEEEDEDADDGVIVPRVKVAEDGSLIIDEESLTVEVLRQKGPNPADDGDPIFERGSTTTYSSFRKGTHIKPWSNKETDMFFLAINMVGTDFSIIGQLFPHRGRTEIKNKFKKEERANSWRIDKAFKEKRRLDLEFFTSLLEKILAVEAKRNKKNKSPTEKKVIKKKKMKPKENKAANQLSDVEEEGSDAEMYRDEVEGEKENVSNEGTTPAADATTPKRKRKRKDGGGESSPEKAKDGKKKKSDQEEAGVPEDCEAGAPEGEVPEDQSPAESSKRAEGPVEGAKGHVEIKPAQLSHGRPQRPLPILGRKWGQAKPKEKEKENTEEGVSKEQVDKDASSKVSKKKKKAGDVFSSEGEEKEANDEPIKPTRIPQKTQLLNYPAKEEGDSPSDSAPAPASDGSPSTFSSSTKPKAKPPTRRARIKPGPALPGRKGQSAARKPKLITLRASQFEDEGDDDDEEGVREQREEAQAEEDHHNPTSPGEENQAPAFVPMSLRLPQPVATEVEETMEELDISVNLPDVLAISQDAFCPDLSCDQAQGEMGTVPCEHQLDLLVDVNDFLSPDNMEVSEESYNEAARTLLAISNLTHLSQAAEAFTAGADYFITEECSNEEQPYQMSPQPTDQSQTSTTPSESLTPDLWVTEASQTAEDSVPVATSTASLPVSKISAYVAVTMTTTTSVPVTTTTKTASVPITMTTDSVLVTTTTASVPVTTTTASVPVTTTTACIPVTTTTASVPVTTTTSFVPVTTTTSPVPVTTTTSSVPVTTTTSSVPVTMTTASVPVTTTTASVRVTTNTASAQVPQSSEATQETTPTEEESLRQWEGMVIGHASHVESCSEVSKQQTTSQTRRSHFPKVKPNLGRAARTTQPKPTRPIENTTTQPKPTRPIENTTTQPKPTRPIENTTTQPKPTRPIENTTTQPKPTRPIENTTTQPKPTRPIENTTTQPKPTRPIENTTTQHKPTRPIENTTTQPKPTRPIENTTTQPKPTRPIENTTTQPKPTRPIENTTTQPKPTRPIENTTTQPKPTRPIENTATQAKPPQYTITQSEPPPQPMLNITATSEPQPTKNITTEPPLPTESITTESEPQPKQRSTTHAKPQPTANIITYREPQTIQRTRVAHSKPQCTQNITTLTEPPQPTLDTTTQSEPPQPTLDTTTQSEPPQPTVDTTTQSEPPQPTLNTITNTLSEPQSGPSLEQPGPGTRRPRAPVPESPLRSSEKEKGCDGPKEYTSSSLSAVGSQSKQTGPPTRRARLPKPKPNLGRTARATTRTASQVPESRNCPVAQIPDVATRPSSEVQRPVTGPCAEVQTPGEADEVPMEIQQIHQVIPLTDIIDVTQEEIQPIHQVIPLTDIIDATQEDTSLLTEGIFFSQQSDALITQHSESSGSTVLLDPAQPDPDEPIFILSLTEIPFFPTGEEYGCTSQTLSEPLSFLPVADTCSQLQQSSDIVAPGGGMEEGCAGILCKVPEPMSVDEVLSQPTYPSIKEVESGSTAGPVDVCASMADAETREDTDPPCKKRKLPERARRDKLQVRANTAVRKQPSCLAPAKESVSASTPDHTTTPETDHSTSSTPDHTTTIPETDHPTAPSPPAQQGPSVTGTASGEVAAEEPQQEIVGRLDLPETEEDTPTGGDEMEDSRSGAESRAARQMTPLATSGPLSRPGRRPRGFLSFMFNKTSTPAAAPSAPPRGHRAAPQRPQVNTTQPGGKRAAPAPSTTRTMPALSTRNTTTRSTRTVTGPDSSLRVTWEQPSDVQAFHSDPEPSTSQCTTTKKPSQVPATQPCASPCVDRYSADEEPINVSQYFFSDIFTEVEESEG
ncbi:mucin-5AC isoform X1 [Coregonus clupeaformis]|uniref:mucin-5AC isoform X1 n=1 Tax=Coregonus clupeaformis TaxID=59861 RepID=UPI001E1C3069|nr:mucin-5AC isoform X1 [Coregonus clupeaformis]